MLIKAIKPFEKRQPGQIFDEDGPKANDLIRLGLAVAIKGGKTPQNKAAQKPENKSIDGGKALAAGEDLQSSVSQAAPASQQPTANPSEPGARRPILRLRAKPSR